MPEMMAEDEIVVTGCCTGQSWCAITCTSEVLSRKWHTVIVHELLDEAPVGFSALKARIEDVSGKVLSESLDDLVEKNLVVRDVIQQAPRRVEYALTESGRDLRPVIEAMETWGRKHLAPDQDHVGVEDVFGNRIR